MAEPFEKLREELKGCTAEELWLIYDTQKELYSEEELSEIRQMAKRRQTREEEEKASEKKLRAEKMRVCESCGTVNDPGAGRCVNCGQKLKAKKSADPQKRLKRLFALCYAVGILLPPIGIVISLVLVFSGETYRRAAGINCFWISVFSVFAICFAAMIYFTAKA